ncbi:class I SAM-dependent methyltransferase [Carboxylicivirga marina]|uniref:Methyltransferase domain-containing protein n=1 Tax=Carboxylicivirga marina TaxID=2800988 RepID=A0ABS1HMT1_9BACT|nr:class I SAM-dependent methyltransferase [Carboxylicivirga marina]MBK3518976.1 methyltransferase domain-containing protein [Carboxylicivirga marina]
MSDTFFEREENVKQYIEMTADYDGRWFFEQFKKFIPRSHKALELGMGPGKDLDNIRQEYDVVGSDFSFVFAELYKRSHPEVKIKVIDAVKIKTKEYFDCIYTNKVLHHLTFDDIKASIKRQAEVLNDKGIVLHTFWKGTGQENYGGMLFHYYETETVKELFSELFNIIHIDTYQEFKEDDSIIIVAQKR